MPLTWSQPVEIALAWLSDSDIRQKEEASYGRGGIRQGYNWVKRNYPFIYSEITGYAISVFVNAFRWSGQTRYLDLARESAQFILGIQDKADRSALWGAIPLGISLPNLEVLTEYHSFDAAMCLQGLLDLNGVDPSPELPLSAQAIGDWLTIQMQQDNGTFLSMVDPSTGEQYHYSGQFFDDCGCLHAKHAIGLLKLGRVTGEKRYIQAAQRVCNWVLGLQAEDGAFWATEARQKVVSHSHCYTTEGLLVAAAMLKNDRYLEAAHRAGLWLLRVQNPDGSINIDYKQTWWRMGRRVFEKVLPRRVSDATAQAIRIWLGLYSTRNDPQYLEAAQKAYKFLRQIQVSTSTDRNAIGGYPYWPGHPMLYTWCTMFAIHALYALEHQNRQNGYQSLIPELF